jgi:hypothetical protein
MQNTMLHENGVPRPLVPASAIKPGVPIGRGMPDDSGQATRTHTVFIITSKCPLSILKILPMPPCSNWYGQKNFGKPNAEIEQIMVDQKLLVCYNIGILQKQYFNLNF